MDGRERKEMDEDKIKAAIKETLRGLSDLATTERKQSQPYKDMFKASEFGLRGAIDQASNDMMRIVLNLCQVIEDRTGVKVDNDLFLMLSGLPLFTQLLRKHITDAEGCSCCADKMREIAFKFALNKLWNKTD